MKNYLWLLVFLVACSDKGKIDHSKDADVNISEMLLEDKSPQDSAAHKSFLKKFNQDRVFFGFDKYAIGDDHIEYLDNVIEYLKVNLDLRVEIQGNCDIRGPVAYNIALGQRRADSVKKYLIKQGVAEHRISSISFGSRVLVAGESEEAYEKNRVSIIVIK